MSDLESLLLVSAISLALWIMVSLAYWWSQSSPEQKRGLSRPISKDLTTYGLAMDDGGIVASAAAYNEYNERRKLETTRRISQGMNEPVITIAGEVVEDYPALNPARVPALPAGYEIEVKPGPWIQDGKFVSRLTQADIARSKANSRARLLAQAEEKAHDERLARK